MEIFKNPLGTVDDILLREKRQGEPSDLGSWIPLNWYDFVDLGCGEQARQLRYSASGHPDWQLLGIDPVFEHTTTQGNLSLVKARAHEILSILTNGNIGNANAYFFLNNVPEEYAVQVLELLRAKFAIRGQLHVGHRNEAGAYVRDLVIQHGFKVSDSVPMELKELEWTPSGQYDFNTMKSLEALAKGTPAFLPEELTRTGRFAADYMSKPEAFQPMKFTATLG